MDETVTFSQERMRSGEGVISGIVIDRGTNKPMEYAHIILFSAVDSTMVTGIVSGKDGGFSLPDIKPGKYYADINFIGFEKKRINNIHIGSDVRQRDLGKISLKPSAIALDAVDVKGTRPAISYQIDKKVIDVGQMQTVVSGNAADVLENVPSVSVDAEGTVSLRGSTDFTVLVDGRPSILDAQDVLQQIPATSIQTIEIITNPSAKYNPEGTSGIINVLLKKVEESGLNGISHLNAGLNDKYGGEFLLEYKNSVYTANFGADFNRRFSPGTEKKRESYTVSGNTTTTASDGTTRRGREFWGFRGGLEFFLGEKDVLSVGGRYGSGEMRNALNFDFSEQAQSGNLFFKNIGDSFRKGNFFSLNTNYVHKFERPEHELAARLTYGYHGGDEMTLTESFVAGAITDGKKTSESGPSRELEGKIEYTLPLGAKNKFEAGYEGGTEIGKEITGLNEYDTVGRAYRYLPQFSHDSRNTDNDHAIYSLYSDEWGNFGFQGGIRGTYTNRQIELLDQSQTFRTEEWDFFPTFHASYKFQSGHQLMASYTRRVRRPHGWSLEPFLTWTDANNVQQGHPELKNEYVDSYEAGGQLIFGKTFLSAEAFYRMSHNEIEEVRSAYSENVTLTTFQNVGNDYSLGSEIQFNYEPLEAWNVNLLGNLYQYRIEGAISNEPFSRESFNWSARFNNTIKFASASQVQLNARYRSATVSSQGREEGFFTTDLSFRQDLFGRSVTLTLQIRDLFKTGKHESTTQGPGYYSYDYSTHEAPMVMLSIKFLFNNYSQEERQQGGEESSDEGETF